MKVYLITSEVSSTPLAEVRTTGPGGRVDFTVDNTEGALPAQVNGSYDRLEQIVSRSSHLRMKAPTKATANLVRYIMDNGDVVEMTTDGLTCLLNGEMLDDERKRALFNAIRTGQLKVARKADSAVTVATAPDMRRPPEAVKPKTDQSIIHLLAIMHAQDKAMEKNYNARYDRGIEDQDYSYSDDPAFSKNFAYALKHGRGQDA